MLIIKMTPNENIERSLKRYKLKLRKTQLHKKLKENRYFLKKSENRRIELQNAVYKQDYFRNMEN